MRSFEVRSSTSGWAEYGAASPWETQREPCAWWIAEER
jgi:hypothetical protein